MYKPERWVVIKIKEDNQTFYKLLGGWSGSYLEGQSWRMNSGISEIVLEDDFYLVKGFSGSIYKCHKNGYGTNLVMNGIIAQMKSSKNYQIEVLEDQDFSQMSFNEK